MRAISRGERKKGFDCARSCTQRPRPFLASKNIPGINFEVISDLYGTLISSSFVSSKDLERTHFQYAAFGHRKKAREGYIFLSFPIDLFRAISHQESARECRALHISTARNTVRSHQDRATLFLSCLKDIHNQEIQNEQRNFSLDWARSKIIKGRRQKKRTKWSNERTLLNSNHEQSLFCPSLHACHWWIEEERHGMQKSHPHVRRRIKEGWKKREMNEEEASRHSGS